MQVGEMCEERPTGQLRYLEREVNGMPRDVLQQEIQVIHFGREKWYEMIWRDIPRMRE